MSRTQLLGLLSWSMVLAAFLMPSATHSKVCTRETPCVTDNVAAPDISAPASNNVAVDNGVTPASVGNATRPKVKGGQAAKAGNGASPDLAPNKLLAWAIVALITIVGLLVAIYPIGFYVRQAWQSRQKGIFETLNISAKRQYLELYRASDASNLDSDDKVNVAFTRVYNHWFGKGRLVTPAVMIGAVILAYVFLAAVRAAQALLPAPLWQAPFTLPDTAVAAITGAYILVTMDTISHLVRRDLSPEDLQLTALRLVSCVPFGYAFASLVQPSVAPFVALAITAIPLQQIAALLGQLAGKQLGVTTAAAAGPGPDAPSQLAGVDSIVCERLSAIGINTITQVAYSDPVQLTMRTSLNFVYVLDVVSQALAWVYLEQKLNLIRPIALRGAYEIAALDFEAEHDDANAKAVLDQLPEMLGMTPEQCRNIIHQIADDRYTKFLVEAYGS